MAPGVDSTSHRERLTRSLDSLSNRLLGQHHTEMRRSYRAKLSSRNSMLPKLDVAMSADADFRTDRKLGASAFDPCSNQPLRTPTHRAVTKLSPDYFRLPYLAFPRPGHRSRTWSILRSSSPSLSVRRDDKCCGSVRENPGKNLVIFTGNGPTITHEFGKTHALRPKPEISPFLLWGPRCTSRYGLHQDGHHLGGCSK